MRLNLATGTIRSETAEEMRALTPATEAWVQQTLALTGQFGLQEYDNMYAYKLREFEMLFPRIAGFIIPLFARAPLGR